MDTVAFVPEGMELRAVHKSKGKYFVNPTDTLPSQRGSGLGIETQDRLLAKICERSRIMPPYVVDDLDRPVKCF